MARRVLPAVAALVFLVLARGSFPTHVAGQASGLPSTKNGDWPHYTADLRGTRYSPLDQINGANFNQLEVAWRFKTDNLGPRPEYKLEGTPLARRPRHRRDSGPRSPSTTRARGAAATSARQTAVR